MNFLPILQRELLVQARRPAMHWTRLALAGFFALLVMPYFLGGWPLDPVQAGRYAFASAQAVGFALACGACLLTADALSSERREGTLGLLLLTPMTVPAVVLGKLAAAGFTVLLALLGLVPALMLPLLAGGVTPAEAARSGLALIVLAWLALAVGLWASAQEHEQPRAIRRAVGWLAGLILVPLLLGWVARATGAGSFFPGPVDALGAGSATAYPVAPARYWINLGGLLAAAAVVLWQAQARLRGQAPDEMPRTTPPPTSRARQLLGNGDPLAWRLRRGGTLIRSLWVAAAALSVGSSAILMQFYSTGFGETWRLLYYAGQWGGVTLAAWAAGRFFAEAARTGELELLRTTPAGARSLLAAHQWVLTQVLRGPLGLIAWLAGAKLLWMQFGFQSGARFGGMPLTIHFHLVVMPLCMDLLSLLVAVWVGTALSLRLGRPAAAVVATVALVEVIPYLATVLWQLAARALLPSALAWAPGGSLLLALLHSLGTGPAMLLLLALWGRREIRRFALHEGTAAGELPSLRALWNLAAQAAQRARHWTP